ncbi:hypothetical protein GJ700_04965 [Duganella sp. FT92W]|uniref:TadE-like domain-containing protein n=1 Tax=Pseudoduganella rivuli TaxID=2666085 RepID=A0A7X2LSS0_9BURK|nr:hypothetical protein [Pseudoduganella rivuli]MRV71069.1 hypothetical protein [Pseudoduganella rivuli]
MTRRVFRCVAPRRARRGVAAIELALVLCASVLLAPALLSIGTVFLNYVALHKAVHEGARAMAALPPQALGNNAAIVQARAATAALVVATAQQAGLATPLTADIVFVGCDGVICNALPASTVTVSASVNVPMLPGLFSTVTSDTLQLQAIHTMRYGYATN